MKTDIGISLEHVAHLFDNVVILGIFGSTCCTNNADSKRQLVVLAHNLRIMNRYGHPLAECPLLLKVISTQLKPRLGIWTRIVNCYLIRKPKILEYIAILD